MEKCKLLRKIRNLERLGVILNTILAALLLFLGMTLYDRKFRIAMIIAPTIALVLFLIIRVSNIYARRNKDYFKGFDDTTGRRL